MNTQLELAELNVMVALLESIGTTNRVFGEVDKNYAKQKTEEMKQQYIEKVEALHKRVTNQLSTFY